MPDMPDMPENPGIARIAHARPRWILPVIVLSQFAATSLWFAGNAVLGDLQAAWDLPANALGLITSAVQFGFVAGTLCFALLSLSDRYPPPAVFLICALLGAGCNLAVFLFGQGLGSLLFLRFATGFFLAGIYPVGMKIAASWYEQGLGRAIGYLLGALVLGTAFPHLLRGLGSTLAWEYILAAVSAIAVLGGLAVYFLVPVGPYLPARTVFSIGAIPRIFRSRDLRSATFGYFGHMWELYALWAFLPVILAHYAQRAGLPDLNVSLWSFYILGIGALGCVGGGLVSQRAGSARVAFYLLAGSGLACLLSPIMLLYAPPALFLCFMLFWGITVAGDSPQFSTVTANSAPREYVGTALTLVNCIGFTITAISIQVISLLSRIIPIEFLFLVLVPGPLLGVFACRNLLLTKPAAVQAQ